MTRTITAIALAATLTAAGLSAAGAQDMEMGFNMLTGAVYNALSAQGFDTANINQLTLSEIAEIKALLEGDDMGNAARTRINKILEN